MGVLLTWALMGVPGNRGLPPVHMGAHAEGCGAEVAYRVATSARGTKNSAVRPVHVQFSHGSTPTSCMYAGACSAALLRHAQR